MHLYISSIIEIHLHFMITLQDALCIDLSSMDSVRVDPQKKLAYIGAGGEW